MDNGSVPELRSSWRRAGLSLRRFLILIIGIAPVVVLVAAGCAPPAPSGIDKGEHLTLAETRGRVQLELPEAASDIRFYQHLKPNRVVVVDFAVREDAFLEWAAQQGWKTEPVQGSVKIWPRSWFGDQATCIEIFDGYNHHDIHRGMPNQLSATFDRTTGRAYYNFDSDPAGDN